MTYENQPQPSLLERSVENVSTVLGVVAPSLRQRAIHAGLGDVLAPAIALLLVQTLGYWLLQPFAVFNAQVLQGFVGAAGLALLAMALCLVVLRKGSDVLPMVVGVLWALVLGHTVSIAAFTIADVTSPADWMVRKFGAVYLWPLVFLLFRLGAWSGASAFTAFALPALLLALPWLASLRSDDPSNDVAYFNPDIEVIYAAQPRLLNAQIKTLRVGDPDRVELFAVLGAGYPYEGVFRREVEAVGRQLADRFGAQDRVISLVNSDEDQESYPLMNRVNLRASLKAISKAMNPDDLALLFLTSHGSQDLFATNFYEVITRNVTPEDVDAALKEAGIKNAVIIVSACFSGSFIDALAAPSRLVLTAADADSVSFGCNDKNEWTEWGRAFFVDALGETRDFREAARLAQQAVLKREEVEALPPSSPQIVEGTEIGRILDRWLSGAD